MKPDLYTKAVLTVIAMVLTAIACKPFFSPDTIAQAQGSFAGVQYTGAGLGGYFFDSRTGDMWTYGKGQGQTS